MRISDWSSDVCSSDLPVERFTSNIHLNLRDPSLGVINLKALSTELDIAVLHDDTGRIREEAVNNGLSRVLPFDVITSGQRDDMIGHRIDRIDTERSEERRGGNGCVSTCRSGWGPYH